LNAYNLWKQVVDKSKKSSISISLFNTRFFVCYFVITTLLSGVLQARVSKS